MKKLLLLTGLGLTLAGLQPVAAQYYILPYTRAHQNPGNLNQDGEGRYDLGQPSWNLLLTGSAATQAAPVWSAAQTLPFGFQLGGQAVSGYKVSSSGVLTFSTAATAVPPTLNAALPSVDVPDKSVCLWGTLMTANTDYLITKTFGTAPNRQHWVQFNSVSLPVGTNSGLIPGSFFYASIVLEETTNKVYLVWQRAGADAQTLTAGVQINATTAYQTTTSPNTSIPGLGSATSADNQYFEFAPGVQPTLDLAGNYLTVPNTAARNSSVSIQGVFTNVGTQTVTGLTANYRVNNGPVVSAPLTGFNVATLDTGAFVHPMAYVPTVGGVLKVRAWMSAPNGGLDQQLANDTMRTTFVVGDSTMRRKVVLEDFTSSTCPPCRPGNINTRAINTQPANRDKFVEIKLQQNFPAPGNDPYYSVESGARFAYYSGSFVPYMLVNSSNTWKANDRNLANSGYYSARVLDSAYTVPAIVRVGGSYIVSGTTVSARAFVRPLLPIPAGRFVAHMYITERETRLNARTNGETRFYDVMKKMMPDQNGTPLPALASGQTFNLNLSHTFQVPTLPVTWQYVEHFDSLRVVVLVQDMVTKEIYQGEYLTLSRPTSSFKSNAKTNFYVYPNPGHGKLKVDFSLEGKSDVELKIIDSLGRIIANNMMPSMCVGQQSLELDTSNNAPGFYTVTLVTKSGAYVQKLVIN